MQQQRWRELFVLKAEVAAQCSQLAGAGVKVSRVSMCLSGKLYVTEGKKSAISIGCLLVLVAE